MIVEIAEMVVEAQKLYAPLLVRPTVTQMAHALSCLSAVQNRTIRQTARIYATQRLHNGDARQHATVRMGQITGRVIACPI